MAAQVEPAEDTAGVHQGVSRRSQGGKTDKKDATATGEEAAAGNHGLTTDTQKIVAMMANYVATQGFRVQLTEILDAANK